MKYIKLFENHSNYEDFVSGGTMEKPNVSHCVEENEVHYSQKKLSDEYLTFEILSDGVITWRHTNRSASSLTISYSLDDGKTWSDIESTYSGETFNVSNGDKVLFKGTNIFYSTPVTVESDGFTDIISVPHTFSGSTASFNIRGNILSLFYGDDFADKKTYIHVDAIIGTTQLMPEIFGHTNVVSAENLLLCDDLWIEYIYEGMFYGCTSLTTPPKLPFTTLTGSCYNNMFRGCTSLTVAPELPATTLANYCYQGMFYGCTSLTVAPELPATTLANRCYQNMFASCTSLIMAPELSSLNLSYACYDGMFRDCRSLTTAPELPATTLASDCYSGMFSGCTSLINVPELNAEVMESACYRRMFKGCTSLVNGPSSLGSVIDGGNCCEEMFSGCTNLENIPELPAPVLSQYAYIGIFKSCPKVNYVKCLATNITAGSCTANWLNGVASNGTFVKAASMSSWTRGVDGIPNNWTIQDAS